jgi:hypothetical protein
LAVPFTSWTLESVTIRKVHAASNSPDGKVTEFAMNSDENTTEPKTVDNETPTRPPIIAKPKKVASAAPKPGDNKVVRLLEKNPLGMTLPEMAGGPRQVKKIKTLRPMLTEAIKDGLVMPVSQRAGHTVYKLVKKMGPR